MSKLKRLYDPITQQYVEKELQKLMEEQEAYRQAHGMGGPTDKMPVTGGSGQFGPAEYRYGGKKRKYDGFGETSFLQKPKSIVEEGYEVPSNFYDYNNLGRMATISPGMFDVSTNKNVFNSVPNQRVSVVPQYKQSYPESGIGPANQEYLEDPILTQQAVGQIQKDKADKIALQEQLKRTNRNEKILDYGVLGAQLAGDIVGLGYSLKKPNYAKYQRISPSLVNYNQAATDITNQAALVENSAAGALRNQGQSSGAYLNNRINLASRLGQQTGSQLAELRMNEANTNVGIKNEALTRNAEIQRAETETNAREKDARMQALVGHLGGLGSKVAGYSRDKQAMKLDKAQFDTMMRLYPSLFRASDIVQNTDGTYTVKAK